MKSPSKYSKEWFAIEGPNHGHSNPIKAANGGWPVRLSKSAFMTYLSCSRKYWWNSVAEIRSPQNHFMAHGTGVHRALENLYGNWTSGEGEELFSRLALVDWEDGSLHHPHLQWNTDQILIYRDSLQALFQLENERLERWGEEHFAPVEFEVKHVAKHPDSNFLLVGKIDGVHRHPDGGLVITELKTGKATKGKLTKTRKELCFYRHLLSLLGFDEAIYFYYLFPECANTDLYLELEGKKNTEVWLGEKQGMAVLEKVAKRSVTAMFKSLDKAIEGINTSVWDIKWNDWFCTEWCEFSMSCEGQLIGLDEDPTHSYTGGDEW